MKKIIIIICCLLLCSPVFAGNTLQQKYEVDNTKTVNETLIDVLNLINEDFDIYKNNGDSVYGDIYNQIEKCKKGNRNIDLIYLEDALKSYEQAYNSQSIKQLKYINIDDKDYQNLSKETKENIKAYNVLYLLSQKNENVNNLDNFQDNLNTYKQKFLTDKNNIKQNKDLYEQLKLYENYFSNTQADADKKQDIESLSKEIYDYSYSYEEKKYNDWAKKNNKKFIRGALEQVVYYSTYQPIQNALYIHNPQGHFYLRVVQSVPGGVILTGDPSIKVNTNFIFLETSKQFADNTIITEPLVVEYKGLYKYTTILGAKKTIHKFYRLGAKEQQDNFNIPGQQFYFFAPKITN